MRSTTVEEFARRYRSRGCPIRPPFEASVVVTDTSYSYVIYTEKQFQVTLYVAELDATAVVEFVRDHGVECVALPLQGDVSDDQRLHPGILSKRTRRAPGMNRGSASTSVFLLVSNVPSGSSVRTRRSAPRASHGPIDIRRGRRRWKTVEEFAYWYKDQRFPLRIPPHEPVYKTDNSRSVVVYREGQFQAELYLVKPNTSSPEHSHPGVDSIIVPWGGEFDCTRNGEFKDLSGIYSASTSEGTSQAFGFITARLDDSHTHALHAYGKGAVFLSIEKWREELEPDSVTVRWDGAPVGEEHKRAIRSARQ